MENRQSKKNGNTGFFSIFGLAKVCHIPYNPN